jgi:hypothetical protein
VRGKTIIGLSALLLLIHGGTARAVPNSEEAVSWFLERLEATRQPCPERIEFSGYTEGATCAHTDADTKQLRKRLRKISSFGDTSGIWRLDERISRDGSTYAAKLVLKGSLLLDLYFEPSSGTVVLLAPPSCLRTTDAMPLAAGEHSDRSDAPGVIHWDQALHPARARTERTGGIVVLDFVVGEDGRVGETCVVYESPAGYGFEASGRMALDESRFEPARKDGVPMAAPLRATWAFFVSSPWIE